METLIPFGGILHTSLWDEKGQPPPPPIIPRSPGDNRSLIDFTPSWDVMVWRRGKESYPSAFLSPSPAHSQHRLLFHWPRVESLVSGAEFHTAWLFFTNAHAPSEFQLWVNGIGRGIDWMIFYLVTAHLSVLRAPPLSLLVSVYYFASRSINLSPPSRSQRSPDDARVLFCKDQWSVSVVKGVGRQAARVTG